MKQLVALVTFLVWIGYCTDSAYGQQIRVQNGYIRQGTLVAPHLKTTPNASKWDNLSTIRNYSLDISDYRTKDYSSQSLNYGNSSTIYTGSRGGNYYYNSNGNKVYVRKKPY
jgi:hypothetical protein